MRLASICALGLAVVSICIGGVSIAARRNHDENQARAAMTALAEDRSSGMVAYYSELRADLSRVAGTPAVQRLANGARDARTRREADASLAGLEASLHDRSNAVAVVNVYGAPVALRSAGRSLPPVPLPTALRLSIPIELGDMSASSPYASPAIGQRVVGFSMLTNSQNSAYVALEIPLNELLQQLRGTGYAGRVRLIDPEQHAIVLDSAGMAGPAAVPRGLAPALAATTSVGAFRDGRAVTAFLRPEFLGPGLSGAVGKWVLTATDSSALPTLSGSVGAGSAALVLVGLLVLVLALLGLRVSARRLERLASTDLLTSLGNRRQLLRDLGACFKKLTDEEAGWTLVLLDLDGFKSYNDAFGHAGGDNLLRRLAGRLDQYACEHGATAYRLGGDEFCVLARAPQADQVGEWAQTALTDEGEAFSVSASWGAARLPEEARTAADALKLADERMYVQKSGGRSSAARQVTEVIVSLLEEREPGRGVRLRELANLTEVVGSEFGLSLDELLQLRRATLLHRVGLTAVPSAILDKEEPLTTDEHRFIGDHTTVAQRVLAAAPSLRAVAVLVRATSERFDGSGRPDGLRGTSIPLASRIIAVCAAYAAMTEDRPYRPALSRAAALAELHRCAGSQFDPKVVAVLETVSRREARDEETADARLALRGVPA